jgi:hypothetical protein
MRVCGVELKGSEAIICLLSLDEGLFSIPECRSRKISISDANDAEQLKHFQFTFSKLIADYQVDKVVIKQRQTKGKFAGGYVGFKLEAALQLTNELDVELISIAQVKEGLKQTELMIDFRDTGLKQLQQNAFDTAFAYLSQ